MSPVWNQPPANAARGRVGVAPVAREHLRAAQHDLAALARRAPTRRPRPRCRARGTGTAGRRCRACVTVLSRSRNVSPDTVSVSPYASANHADGNVRAEPLDERDRHLLAAGDDHPHRREVARLDAGHVEDRVAPSPARPTRCVTRDRSISSTTCAASNARWMIVVAPDRDHRGGDEVERADVVQRPAREPDVVGGEAELGDVREVLPRQVGVGEHHALRPPGRARRVHQPVEVVGRDRHARRAARRRRRGRRTAPTRRRRRRAMQTRARSPVELVGRVVGEVDERVVAHERPRLASARG